MLTADDISLIVPVYNGGSHWARVLDAIARLDPAPGEVIVVDDGSTDTSRALAAARGWHVLNTPKPRSGPAAARNLGAAHARGDVLFFIDADVLVYPDAIARVRTALREPNVDAVFGAYDTTPADRSFISQYKNLLHHYVHQTSHVDTGSFWAGCGAIRRELFAQVGGFSTRYARPSIEDIELGGRVHQAGGRIRLVKDLQVKHLKRWTLRSLLVTDIRDRALPWAALLVRQGQVPADLNLQLSSRISAVFCWLLVLLPGVVFVMPLALLAAPALVLALLGLNRDLYRFFWHARGAWFTLRAIPLHWLYYLYSSAAFAYVILTGAVNGQRHTPVQPTASHHA